MWLENKKVTMKRLCSLLAGLVVAISCLCSPAEAVILKKEPAMGALREGQVVYVDDGSCPPGQIKKVTGGNHVKVGGTKHLERRRECVPK